MKVNLNPLRNTLSLDGVLLTVNSKIDQAVRIDSDVQFNNILSTGDLTVDGNFLVNGNYSVIESTVLKIKDALIEINVDNLNPLTRGGIQVNRGPGLNPYQFVYNESDGLFEVGDYLALQPVATREREPIPRGLAVWNPTMYRFDAQTSLGAYTFTDLQIRSLLFSGPSGPLLSTDLLDGLVLSSPNDITINSTTASPVNFSLPNNMSLAFGANKIQFDLASGGTLFSTSTLLLNPSSNLSWGNGTGVTSSGGDGHDLALTARDIVFNSSLVHVPTIIQNTTSMSTDSFGHFTMQSASDVSITTPGKLIVPRIGFGANSSISSDPSGNTVLSTSGNLTFAVNGSITSNTINFGSSNFVGPVADNLIVSSTSGQVILSSQTGVLIANNVPLNLGRNTQLSETSLGDILLQTSNSIGNIRLVPGSTGQILIPLNKFLVFGSTEYIYSNGDDLTLTANRDVILSTGRNVVVPQTKSIVFGSIGTSLTQTINGNLLIASTGDITLAPFGVTKVSILNVGYNSSIDDTSTSLSINTSTYVNFPSPVKFLGPVTFSGSSTTEEMTIGTLTTFGDSSISSGSVLTSTSGIPLVLSPRSSASGVAISFSSSWDSTTNYNMGRGSSGGRSLQFTVPDYSLYGGTGVAPNFTFTTSSGMVLAKLDTGGVTFQSGGVHITDTTTNALIVGGTITSNDIKANNSFTVPSVISANISRVSISVPLDLTNLNLNTGDIIYTPLGGLVVNSTSNLLGSVKTQDILVQGSLTTQQGTIFGGTVSLNGHTLTGIPVPQFESDAVNKAYADNLARGTTQKASVNATSTLSEVLSSSITSIDGVSLFSGYRVLLKDQADPKQNGIYSVDASNFLVRTNDMSTGSNAAGAAVFTIGGTVNSGVGFICIGSEVVVVDTNLLTFTAFTGAAQITVSSGLTKTGNNLSLDIDSTLALTNGHLGLSSSIAGLGLVSALNSLSTNTDQSHVTKVGTISSGTWEGNSISLGHGGTGLTTVPLGRVLFGSTSSALQYSDGLVFTGGKLGLGILSPQAGLHVVTDPSILVEDTTNLGIPTFSLKRGTASATLSLGLSGDLYIGQDETSSSSTLSLATNGLVRLHIDNSGAITTGSITSTGYGSFTGLTTTGDFQIKTTTLSVPSTGNLTLTTPRLDLSSGFRAISSSSIGNLSFETTGAFTRIVSTDPQTNLSIPLGLGANSSIMSAWVTSSGLQVPGVVQIGGTYDDITSGINLTFSSGTLSFSKKTEFVDTLSAKNGISLYDRNGTIKLLVTGNSGYISSSQDGMGFNIGQGTKDMFTVIGNASGNSFVKYDPISTSFIVNSSTSTLIEGDLTLYNNVFDYTSKGVSRTLPNGGWYYLGIMGIGSTTVTASLAWTAVIRYDGITNYSVVLDLSYRNAASLVIYNVGGVYQMYINVSTSPLNIRIIEAPNTLYLTNYEGAGSSPDGTTSGYTSLSWILDYDLTTSPATANKEIGSLDVNGRTSLSSLRVNGSLDLIGSLSSTGNSNFIGTDFFWGRPFGNIASFNSDNFQNNSITVYSGDTSSAQINFNRTSEKGYIGLVSATSVQFPGSMIISHQTPDPNSKLIFATRNIPRVLLSDTGILQVLTTTDAVGGSLGSFTVAGGMSVQKNLSSTSIQTPLFKLTNGSAPNGGVSLQCDTFGNLALSGTNTITGLSNPTHPSDAVTLQYVQGLIQGLDLKVGVIAASNGQNIDLTIPTPTVDGIALVARSRVLLKDQTNAVENGVYNVVASGLPLSRTSDLDSGKSASKAFVFVNQGSTNANSGWVCSTASGNDIVGVNSLQFIQFSGAGEIIAGQGILKTGNRLDVEIDNSSIESFGGILRISSGVSGIGLSGGSGSPLSVTSISHLDTLGTIRNGTWNAGIISMAYGGTGTTGFSNGSVVYSNGATLSQGGLFFDSINKRLGINTTTPTAGVTIQDRDMQFVQTTNTNCAIVLTSAIGNYTYAMRHDANKLIWSGGAGNSRSNLTDLLVLGSTGVLTSSSGIISPYLTLGGKYTYTGNTISNSNGNTNLQLFSSDNSGTILTLYGGLGTANTFTNSEFLRAGYYNGEYRIQTSSTGSGSARDLILQSGVNTGQLVLTSSGDATFSGNVTVSSTAENSAMVILGGMTVGKTITANALNVTNELVSGFLKVNAISLVDWYQNTSSDNSLSFSSQVNSPSYLNLFSLVGSGNTDLGFRVFSKGTDVVGTNNEWFSMRYAGSSQRYELSAANGGSGNYHPISISASGTDQVLLGIDNSVTFSGSSTTLGLNSLLNTSDAVNSSSGGALTVSGGLAVAKKAFFGSSLTVPALNVTSSLNFSLSGSGNSSMSYIGSGQTTLYGNTTQVLAIHAGNSNGPNAVDQEKLTLGYGDTNSFLVGVSATGAGVLKDLVLQSGSKFSLGANGTNTSYGFLQANSGLGVVGASQITGTVNLVGSLSLSHTGVLGNLLNFAGAWSVSQTDVYSTSTIAQNGNSKYIFTNAANHPLLTIDAMGQVTSNTKVAISTTDSRALTIQNAGGTDIFVFDTNLSQMNFGGSRAINAGYPITANDLATKSYVDAVAKGLNLKSSVTAATIVGQNINVTSPVPIVDGVTLIYGNRVLLKDQTNAIENGIYTVLSNGYIIRSDDLASGSNAGGSFTFIQRGTTHADTGYVCTASSPDDLVGTNLLYFTQFNGNTISAGLGLVKDVNNAVSISLAPSSGLSFNAGALQVSPSIAGTGLSFNNGILSVGGSGGTTQLGTVTSGIWRASTIAMQYGGTGSNNFNVGSIVYSDGNVLTSDTSNFYWDSTKKALGIGTNSPDPNNLGDGLTLYNKDLLLQGGKVLFASTTGLYNWQFSSYSNLLTLAYGNSAVKGSLSEMLVFTHSGLGIGYTGASANSISATLDIIGTVKVSGLVTFTTALPVGSGGTGTNSLASGFLIGNGSGPVTSTGVLGNGNILIGNSSGSYSIEGGSTLRSHLGLGIGTNVQAWNVNLDNLSNIVPSTGIFVVGNGTSFVSQTPSAVRSTLGLGSLALLSSINNSNWSGIGLSVSNGGTGNTTFSNGNLVYYNGSIITSVPLVYDGSTGFSFGTTLTAGNSLQMYSGDISVQANTVTKQIGYSIQNSDGTFSWSIHRKDEGSGKSSLIISGGAPSLTKSGLVDNAIFKSNGDIVLTSTSECTDINTGSLVVSGGLSVTKQLYCAESVIVYGALFCLEGGAFDKAVNIGGELQVEGIIVAENTSDANSSALGSLSVAGGASFKKSIYTNGVITLDTTSAKMTPNTFPLTIAGDTVFPWTQDTDITDAARAKMILNSSTSTGGSVVSSLRNSKLGVTWDTILDGTVGDFVLQRTTSSQTRTWFKIAQTTGICTLFSTNSNSLNCLGGASFAKSVQIIESATFGTGITLANTNSVNTSYSSVTLGNDIGVASIFLNSSTRTSDGNGSSMTVRNQIGDLRLQGATSSGITITSTGSVIVDLPTTSNCTSDATSSTSGGALTIQGGTAIAKNLFVGGAISFPGSVTNPTLSTTIVTNVSSISQVKAKSTTTTGEVKLLVSFQVTPTASGNSSFTFGLVNKASNLSARTDITATTIGWSNDSSPINLSGLLSVGVVSTKNIQVNFVANDTSVHFIQLVVYYDIS